MKTTISAIILAKNEEKNIVDCIKGLGFCDEVIVIDDDSTDTTATLAYKHGAKVIKHSLNNDFAKQRNFAMEQAKSDWIFFVDADERVTPTLSQEIQTVLTRPTKTSYYFPRMDYMWGKFLKHGETGDAYFLRLAKKSTGEWKGKVHEVWVTNSTSGTIETPLLHYPHVTISEFLQEINFYSTLRAEELYQQDKHISYIEIVVYPLGKFIQDLFLKFGFLDGTAGLVFAYMMSLHSFLVRGKLWMLWQKK